LHPDETITSLVREIASRLDFPEKNPFNDGSFSSILRWVKTEQNILKKIENGDLDGADREKIWEMVTRDFVKYRKGIKVAYITAVEQTYQHAKMPLPSTS
jgi:hypothetical protein